MMTQPAATVTLDEIAAFEATLRPGDAIVATWTSSGRRFEAPARVIRVNLRTVRVELTGEVIRDGRILFPVGWKLGVDRFTTSRSWDRAALPPALGRLT